MDKKTFLRLLKKSLFGLPQADINERLNFYSEMIDDYMEEGLSEEAAVQRIGNVNEIAAQITADAPASAPAATRKKRSAGQIVLIVLCSPIWLSLAIAAFAVVFSLYVSAWAVIVSLWSVFVSLVSCGFAGILCGIGLAVSGFAIPGLAMVGAALVCGGLSVFTFYGCKATTRGLIVLTKKLVTSETAQRLGRLHNA